jgi:hypothetical protein
MVDSKQSKPLRLFSLQQPLSYLSPGLTTSSVMSLVSLAALQIFIIALALHGIVKSNTRMMPHTKIISISKQELHQLSMILSLICCKYIY